MAIEENRAIDLFEILKNRIVKLDYKPGEILNEVEIASEFGVSRTPVRSTFQKLERHNLLSIVPRYGAQVPQIDFINMKSLFELTKVLDPFATRLAATRIEPEKLRELKQILEELKNYWSTENYQEAINADERFHKIIFDSCGNPWLKSTLEGLHYHTERLWHYCEDYFETMDIFTRTFSKIVEALDEQDEDKSEKYAREHIDDFLDQIRIALL